MAGCRRNGKHDLTVFISPIRKYIETLKVPGCLMKFFYQIFELVLVDGIDRDELSSALPRPLLTVEKLQHIHIEGELKANIPSFQNRYYRFEDIFCVGDG